MMPDNVVEYVLLLLAHTQNMQQKCIKFSSLCCARALRFGLVVQVFRDTSDRDGKNACCLLLAHITLSLLFIAVHEVACVYSSDPVFFSLFLVERIMQFDIFSLNNP